MATNFPIVRFTDSGGNVYYGTTSNWSSANVATGTTPESTSFTLPAGHALSDFNSVTVIANGIPSAPLSVLALNNTDENVVIRVDPNDSNTIQVLAGTTVVATYANNSASAIAIIGDSNSNSVTVDESYGVVNTPISFDGGGSSSGPGDQMTVAGGTGDDTLDLTPTSSTAASMTFDGSAPYSFQNVRQFAFNGGDGNDTLSIDSSTSLLSLPGGIQYNGGNGFNQLQLVQPGSTTPQSSDKYSVGPNNGEGTSVIVGPSGTQTVYFQNLAPVLDTVPAATFAVNATPASNAINYTNGSVDPVHDGEVTIDNQESVEFSDKTTLTINALAGDDTINLNYQASTLPGKPTDLTAITVNGGDPTASDTLTVNGVAQAQDDLVVAPAATGGGVIVEGTHADANAGASFVPVTFTGIEGLNLVGQTGDGDSFEETDSGANATIEIAPGANPYAGLVTGFLAPGQAGHPAFSFVPINFSGFAGFAALPATTSTGTDTVVVDGTTASDQFLYSQQTVNGLAARPCN